MAFPDVIVAAYADNVSFTGQRDQIVTYWHSEAPVSPELTPRDSEVCIPSRLPLADAEIEAFTRLAKTPATQHSVLLGPRTADTGTQL